MAISFIRIDDRVVHGQITTRWSVEYPCDGLIAVNDSIAKNPVLVKAFKSAINKPVHIMTHDEFIEKSPKVLASKKNWFLITKEPIMLSRILVDDNINLTDLTVVVGPQNVRTGTTVIGKNQAINQDEAEAYEKISKAGYKILFALIPDVRTGYWKDIKTKFGF
jgi:PTS system mannose-specific IIB component